jgi:putative component of membrane protein insertase Oxa1/YidC/SpoIIIJ protein YidD
VLIGAVRGYHFFLSPARQRLPLILPDYALEALDHGAAPAWRSLGRIGRCHRGVRGDSTRPAAPPRLATACSGRRGAPWQHLFQSAS